MSTITETTMTETTITSTHYRYAAIDPGDPIVGIRQYRQDHGSCPATEDAGIRRAAAHITRVRGDRATGTPWTDPLIRASESRARRVADARARTWIRAIRRCYRASNSVTIVRDTKSPGVAVERWTDWEKDGSRSYPRDRAAWAVRVGDVPADLRTVSGLVTIDIGIPETYRDGALYTARWLAQGRGYDLRVDSGYLYQGPEGTIVHGPTPESAHRAWRRRTAPPEARTTADGYRAALRTVERPAKAIRTILESGALAPVSITWDDCQAAGLCRAGTDAWIRRLTGQGIDEVGEVAAEPLAQVILAPGVVGQVDLATRALAEGIRRHYGTRKAMGILASACL